MVAHLIWCERSSSETRGWSTKLIESFKFSSCTLELLYVFVLWGGAKVPNKLEIIKATRKDKTIFEKGYTIGWSKKIYMVDKIIAQFPILYNIKELDENGAKQVGFYYSQELQKIELPFDTYQIMKN